MNWKDQIERSRALPRQISRKAEIWYAVGCVLLGLLLGWIAKATDSVSVIGEIGTELGIWVFVATLLAAYSRTPWSAAVHVPLFFLAMLASYYIYGQVILGFFPMSYFIGWLIVSLLSSVAGFVAWFARGKGVIGIIACALPVSILFASGYPAFYTLKPALFFALGLGIVLLLLLPRNWKQRGGAFVLSVLLAWLIDRFYLLGYLPF